MAVCSTPSSPFSAVLPEDAATLLKFLLTGTQKQSGERLERLIGTLRRKENCVHTFGDAVLCGEEPLLQQALEDGADRRPVDQLQHKQVRLRKEAAALSPKSS